jgi:hypothetical protein
LTVAKTRPAANWLMWRPGFGHHLSSMSILMLHLFRLLPFLLGSHRHLALENLAMRHQLSVYLSVADLPGLGGNG